MMTHPGVYCLRSNETGWDEATLWRTYFTLTDLEAVFRSLKSELGLRPIDHHKPIRAEGHLFITVIAYQLVQVIRRRLCESGENASWVTLRRVLEGQQRVWMQGGQVLGQILREGELEGLSHLGAAEVEGHESPVRVLATPQVAASQCMSVPRSPHLLGLWRTFVRPTVALARPAFGRLPFQFPCPGFQPRRLLLGFRDLPLASFETVVRLSGHYTLSAMFGWSGHSPPRHGASRRERGSRQTSCRPGRARPRRKPSALRSTQQGQPSRRR